MKDDPLDRSIRPAKRKHSTFFTMILTQLAAGGPGLALEALTAFHDALSLLWAADPHLAIYVFPTKVSRSLHTKPLISLPLLEDPSFTRNAIEKYTP